MVEKEGELRNCRDALRPWFAELKSALLQNRLQQLRADYADRARAAAHGARIDVLKMDVSTLLSHRPLWDSEDADKRFVGTPSRLTDEEGRVFAMLRNDESG